MASDKQVSTLRYLQKTLQMNPLYESDEIIERRTRATGQTKTKETTEANSEDHRPKVLEQIAHVREVCWKEPVASLYQKIEAIDATPFPDLDAALKRLRVVADQRNNLSEISKHADFDTHFFTCLQRVLVASPRETSELREQVFAAFSTQKLRRRGMKTIQLIKKKVPEIYDLEADWLGALAKHKRVLGQNDSTSYVDGDTESFRIPTWLWIVGAIILMRIVIAIARFSS